MTSVIAGELTVRPEWHAQAACGRNGVLGDDPVERIRRMFPTDGSGSAAARHVCDECPVVEPCRSAAAEFGTWGGVGQRGRGTSGPRRVRQPGALVHGTAHAYGGRGCRCDVCRAGNARRHREYMARRRLAS